MNTAFYNFCIDEYSDKLMRYAYKMSNSEADSADAVQEAYTRLWKYRNKVAREKVKSWLFTTVYRILIDYYRKNKRISRPGVLPDSGVEEKSEMEDYSDAVFYALNRLSPAQKSIVILRDVEEYTYDEISKIMDLSLSQVKVYLFRARKNLRTTLSPINSLKKDQ